MSSTGISEGTPWLLVNGTSAMQGGGLGGTVWFIRHCIESKVDFVAAINEDAYNQLEPTITQYDVGHRIHVAKGSAATSRASRNRGTRQLLLELSRQPGIKAVYTPFGPAYVTFDVPHTMGCADGWATHASSDVISSLFKNRPLHSKLYFLTMLKYKRRWYRRADAFVVETETAASGMAERLKLNRESVHVVANNCGAQFFERPTFMHTEDADRPRRIVYLTSDYHHKNIDRMADYAHGLKALGLKFDFRFVVSVDPDSPNAVKALERAADLNVVDKLEFCGPVPVDQIVDFVDASDVVLQVSEFETFSANYPEAMARRRPIVASHYAFSREVCADSAIYVDPRQSKEVASAVFDLLVDDQLSEDMVRRGERVLDTFPRPDERFAMLMQVVESTLD